MDSEPVCGRCARPVHNSATVCSGCLGVLRADLIEIDDLLDELLTTRTKQDVLSRDTSGATRSRVHPLGFRPGAMMAADYLSEVVTVWASHVVDLISGTVPLPAQRTPATLLLHALDVIERYEHAALLVDQVRSATASAWRAVDRRPIRVFAGRCRCGAELFAREGADHAACTLCREVADVNRNRAAMRQALLERAASAAEISALVGEIYGLKIDRKRINQWHSRGRLHAVAVTGGSQPSFRVGDVVELAVLRQAQRGAIERETTRRNGHSG